tara:strand:- start:350 stop:574 length:225 start_codon:yes stop_codon:yes gene_type:complete
MDKLPNELNILIGSYLFDCKKNKHYIINKEYYKIYKESTENCEKLFILRKNLCKKCDKSKIIRARMIINNLLPN